LCEGVQLFSCGRVQPFWWASRILKSEVGKKRGTTTIKNCPVLPDAAGDTSGTLFFSVIKGADIYILAIVHPRRDSTGVSLLIIIQGQ